MFRLASLVLVMMITSSFQKIVAAEVTFSESSRGVVKRATTPTKVDDAESDPAEPTTSEQDQVRNKPDPQRAARKLAIRPPAQPEVTLQRIRFEGNTVFTDSELEVLSTPFLNRSLRFSDLEQLRVEITRAYTEAGYINSGALLPDQKVTNGEVVYNVVEGKLDNIDVTGTGRLRPGYVEKRIRAITGEPFNSEKLQEGFQRLLDDPLIERMDGQLLPAPQAGSTGLNLNVTPAKPWLLNVVADNHGSPSVGAEQLTFSGTYLNPTGFGDNADFSINLTPGRFNISTAYSVPLNAHDTRLSVNFSSTNSTVVEEPLDDINIDSESNNFGLSLSHPFRRSQQGSTIVGVDLTVRDNSNTLLGQPFSFSAGEEDGDSQVSALRFWQDYTRRGTNQVVALRSSFNLGLDAFGATVHDDDRPDSEFLTWLGQAQYVRNVFDGVGQFVLRADAQLSDGLLLPLERFALGGPNSVRGYRKNQLVRDEAFFASAEYRHTAFSSAKAGTWQLAPFIDYGAGRNRGSEDDDRDTLSSIGLGLLWSRSRFDAELYLGISLEDVEEASDNNLQDDGIYFQFSTRLL